jgi:hypothetical protein
VLLELSCSGIRISMTLICPEVSFLEIQSYQQRVERGCRVACNIEVSSRVQADINVVIEEE